MRTITLLKIIELYLNGISAIITALFLLTKLLGGDNINKPIEFSVIIIIGFAFLINILLRFRKE
tara:strand:+ start:3458 stop:3649 length:192 start_codon:yes stop_codon:yes gene_type:complete